MSKKIYHGGCVDCIAQDCFGKIFCWGCQYHKANWSLPDLSINFKSPKNSNKSGSKIYHGGCINCVAQNYYGKNYCKKCQYRKPNWSLPDLRIIDEKDIKKVLRKLKLQKIYGSN